MSVADALKAPLGVETRSPLEIQLSASIRWVRLNNALRTTLDDILKARQAWRALLGSKPAKAEEWKAYGRVRALERRAVRISTILEAIEERTERKVVRHG